MSGPSLSDLHARREALNFSLSQAKTSVPALLCVLGAVAWLGHRADAGWPLVVWVVWGLVGAVWRLMIAPRFGPTQALDAQRIERIERQVQANMLSSGLMWAFGSATIFPHLDATAGVVYVMIVLGNISAAAFLMAPVARSFALLVMPTIVSILGVMLFRGDPTSLVIALMFATYLVVMVRASTRLRDLTLLAFQRGHEMEQTNVVLRQATVDAEAAMRAKTRFLATMSHELRTPLNGLLGALELLGRAPLASPQRRLVDIARSSGSGLLAVLDDVLDYAKLDVDQVAIRPQPTDVRALVESVVALFSAPAHAKQLALRSEVAVGVPAWVQADAQRLRQVLFNLVGNAVKFTDRGQVAVTVRAVDAGLCFEVVDTGIGIAPEACARLFDPFHQVHDGSDRSHGGTGLGLAISQRLVQAMGGLIEVDSAPGEGARFAFTLVLPASEPSTTVAPPPRPGPPRPVGPGGRVLLVEDNEVNRVLAVELLKVLGVEVAVAHDGVQALERLRQGHIDLVLMDCQMPNLDGYAATWQWREHERDMGLRRLPVVAMTANVMPEDVERTQAAGMDDVLGKPYTVDQLKAVLVRWLPGRTEEPRPAA